MMQCGASCPQYQIRSAKGKGTCTLQAISMASGQECSMLKKFLGETERRLIIED